jgi:hypothetical protein
VAVAALADADEARVRRCGGIGNDGGIAGEGEQASTVRLEEEKVVVRVGKAAEVCHEEGVGQQLALLDAFAQLLEVPLVPAWLVQLWDGVGVCGG